MRSGPRSVRYVDCTRGRIARAHKCVHSHRAATPVARRASVTIPWPPGPQSRYAESRPSGILRVDARHACQTAAKAAKAGGMAQRRCDWIRPTFPLWQVSLCPGPGLAAAVVIISCRSKLRHACTRVPARSASHMLLERDNDYTPPQHLKRQSCIRACIYCVSST